MEDSLGHGWDDDSPPLRSKRAWDASSQDVFVSSPEAAHVRSRFSRSGTIWMRAITVIRVEPGHPILVIRDTFEGAGAAAPKVLTFNLMATEHVGTPAGPVRPPGRTHPRAEHQTTDSTHRRPSVTPPIKLRPGVTRFAFSGRHGVDWEMYNVGLEPQTALIGHWSVTPWGMFITDKEESQYILRVRGAGAFTSVILPWRRGEKPSGLSVRQDGNAVVVHTGTGTTRITPAGYSSTTAHGTLNRTFE
jgi:hypothetical protein